VLTGAEAVAVLSNLSQSGRVCLEFGRLCAPPASVSVISPPIIPDQSREGGGSSNNGAMIGIAAGAAALLALLALIILVVLRRRKNKQQQSQRDLAFNSAYVNPLYAKGAPPGGAAADDNPGYSDLTGKANPLFRGVNNNNQPASAPSFSNPLYGAAGAGAYGAAGSAPVAARSIDNPLYDITDVDDDTYGHAAISFDPEYDDGGGNAE
jgi:hypothetical protein